MWLVKGRARILTVASAAALAASMILTAAPAGAATGPVSATPASGTPQLAATGTLQQVRQLVQCGGTMYAVGTFTTITRNGTTYTRNNVFSFSATDAVHGHVVGPERQRDGQLHRVQPATAPPPTSAGKFTTVGGRDGQEHRRGQHLHRRARHRLRAQRQRPGRDPAVLQRAPADRRLLHLDQQQHRQPVHDQPEPGHRQGRRVRPPEHLRELPVPRAWAPTRPGSTTSSSATAARWTWSKATSPRSAAMARQQIFMLDLSGSTAAVTGWTSTEFNTNCNFNEAF